MGLWFSAKMGKHIFGHAKEMLLTQKTPWNYVDATLILVSIALRHRRYRSEVTKLLNRNITGMSEEDFKFCNKINKAFASCLTNQAEYKEKLENLALNFFKVIDTSPSKELVNNTPLHIKIATIAHYDIHFLKNNKWLTQMVLLLPWMVQLEAEEFYIPEQYNRLFSPYKIENAMSIVKAGLFDDISPGVLKDRGKPGRNQPCNCGSGKKYKRCCFKK